MPSERTRFDRLIEPTVQRLANRSTSYFWKSSIVTEIMSNKSVIALLADLRKKHGDWKLDVLIKRYVEHRVGQELGKRDANSIRLYECYAAHESERRWKRLRAMTADELRVTMMQTRVQARDLHLKGEAYHIIIEELEKLGRPGTVDDVYERALPRIIAYRQAA